MDGVTPTSLPWGLKSFGDYERECEAHEVSVVLESASDLHLVLGALAYDKKKTGPCGRALQRDLPSLHLLRFDRLEPTPALTDVSKLDAVTVFPFRVVFWRAPRNSGWTRHRNPLFSRRTHVGPELICVDELHTMYLGVFQAYVLAVLWQLLENDAWAVGEGLTEEAALATSALRLRSELFAWYSAEERRAPSQAVYKLNDFTLSTLGSKRKPLLHAKAAESGTLVKFAVHLARKYGDKLVNKDAAVDAGECLLQYIHITRKAKLRMSVGERQNLTDAMIRFLVLREAAGLQFKPKMHLMLHLVQGIGRFGNPLHTGTWVDEGLNHDMVKVGSNAHALVWARRVLAAFASPSGPTAAASLSASKRSRRS